MIPIECEVCGAPNALVRARIEGSVLTVCDRCAKHGEEIYRPPVIVVKGRKARPIEGLDDLLKEDFPRIIRDSRAKKGLSQKQLAARMGESASIVRRAESGWEPPMQVVRKFERSLNVALIEKAPEIKIKSKSSEALTLGDIAKMEE